MQQGPEHVTGHGGGLLRRILSRNLSQGSIKQSGPNLRHSPRAKMSPLAPHMKSIKPVVRDSPRKASAPAILSPSQQEEILSITSSTKPQRTTIATVEFSEQKKSSPRRSTYISGHSEAHGANPDLHDLKHRRNIDHDISGRQNRINKRTSLSSLAETGFVAPPTPGTMKYHNVIPARASLFLRQKSKHHSRDDIGTSPFSPDIPRASLHPRRTSIINRKRSLLSKKSLESNTIELKTFSYSDADHSTDNVKQLVTDIDGLMSQLTSIKRRLSVRGGGVSPNRSPLQQSEYETPGKDTIFSTVSEEGLLIFLSFVCSHICR